MACNFGDFAYLTISLYIRIELGSIQIPADSLRLKDLPASEHLEWRLAVTHLEGVAHGEISVEGSRSAASRLRSSFANQNAIAGPAVSGLFGFLMLASKPHGCPLAIP
jgi:hypothetical protein